MNEATPIPLPGLKRVWKVRIADSIEKPQVATAIMVRGETAMDALTKTPRTESFQAFKHQHQDAGVVEILYLGQIEN
jgi:hypothetical protein